MAEPLRIGLLLQSWELPAWQIQAIQQVLALPDVEIVGVLLTAPSAAPRGSTWFDKLDRKLFVRRNDPCARQSLRPLLPHVPVLDAAPSLDVLVQLGSGVVDEKWLQKARWGVWAWRFGQPLAHPATPPGFWEVWANDEVSSAALVRLGVGQHHILHRSWFPTYPFSPAKSRQLYFWTISTFLARKLQHLQRAGGQALLAAAPAETVAPARIPRGHHALRLLARVAARALRRKLDDWRYKEQWVILYQFQDAPSTDFQHFSQLTPPPHRYWADPHILEHEGRFAILFEDYEYASDKGRLAAIEISRDGQPTAPRVILEKPWHLSYPFVFSHEGRHYMIPESGANETIDLYECVEFPHRWQFKMTLMSGVQAADTTLVQHQGKWWLFATMRAVPGSSLNYELFLFFADDFATDQWTPHPQNPVVTDVRRARPAGAIFRRQGRLIRPAQNSARGYGRSIQFNEILTLTEAEYAERSIESITPDWDEQAIGVHTYQHAHGLTVIDALFRK